jgi:hypothetical protein
MIYPIGRNMQTKYDPKVKSVIRKTAKRNTAADTIAAPVFGSILFRFICSFLPLICSEIPSVFDGGAQRFKIA